MVSGIVAKYKSFFRDAITLVSTTAAAKIMGLFMVPVVSRLFDPDDFGIVALVLTISMIFGPVASLRYEKAIVLPESEHVAIILVKLSGGLLILTSIVIAILTQILSVSFTEIGIFKEMGGWVYIIPVLILLTGYGNILLEWCARTTRYKSIGVSEITVSLVNNGTRILLGIAYGSSIFGLIAGNVFSMIARIIVLWGKLKNTISIRNGFGSAGEFKTVAKQYKEFPLYSMPTGLLNTSFQKLPVIMLGLMFLPGVVGLYAMASRLGRLPIDIIGLPLRKIYVQRIAKIRNKGLPLRWVLVKTTLGLFGVGILPFTILLIYGEEIFGFVLGDKWSESGIYASMLMPWLFSIFVISPSSANFVVLKKQKLWLWIQVCVGVMGMMAFAIGYYTGAEPREVLLLFSLLGALSNTLVLIIAYSITLQSDKKTADNQI